jgi:hypothetical protein
LAGPEVTERFLTSFAGGDQLDPSARSRLDLWKDCLDATIKNPVFGLGPHHFPLVAPMYGWPLGKEAHTLWLQIMAELGVPGFLFLVTFYGLTMVRMAPYVLDSTPVPDPWMRDCARAVMAGLIGFAIAAQFVSLPGLEAPFYIALMGAGILKLMSAQARAAVPAAMGQPFLAQAGGPLPAGRNPFPGFPGARGAAPTPNR